MFQHNIARNIDIRKASAPAAAGASDVTGDTIDTLGYESVLFITHFGAIVTGAATYVKLQHGDASNASDMADIASSKVTVADDQDNLLVLAPEIHRPTKRYVRIIVSRATQNSTVNSVIALLGRGSVLPPAKDSTVSNTATVLVAPVSGTA